MPFEKISPRAFFLSDLLFRLNFPHARAVDLPLPARYGVETSGLRIGRIIPPFLVDHLRNLARL